jgi:hypothetical protein
MATTASLLVYKRLGFKTVFSSVGLADDPRGIFPTGMVPADRFQYAVVATGVGAGVGEPKIISPILPLVPTLFVDDVQLTSVTKSFEIFLFQGRDVFDLPTADLPKDGNFVTVPDTVFRVLNAGTVPFITPDTKLPDKFGDLSNNPFASETLGMAKQVDPSKPPTNKIELTGSAKFVSYVAVDKYLFHEKFVARASLGAFGLSQPGVLGSRINVVRFVLHETGTPEVPKIQWRMSESWRLDTSGVKNETPKDLREALGAEERSKNSIDFQVKHYVYDLNDPEQTDHFQASDASSVKMNAYSPALAKAKLDQTSKWYDAKFAAQITDYDLGLGASNDNLTVETTTGASTFDHVSQRIRADLPQNTRFGINLFGSFNFVLVRTRPAAGGIGAFHDTGTQNLTYVYDVLDNGNPSERMFIDGLWTTSPTSPPTSKLKSLMVGEFPLRSNGSPILIPQQQPIETDVSSTNVVSRPDGEVVTGATFQSGGKEDSVLSVFEGSATTGTPAFESSFSIPSNISKPAFFVPFPMLRVGAFSGDGYKIKQMFGIKEGTQLAAALPGDQNSTDPSEFQIAQIQAQLVPISAASITACIDLRGISYVAFENSSRVDLAFRTSATMPYALVRDGTLRIVDDFDQTEKTPSKTDNTTSNDPGKLPSSELPFLLADRQTQNIFLFYTYKSSILAKRIPTEIFQTKNMGNSLPALPAETETALIKQLHGLGASVVYEGTPVGGTSLETDAKLGAIKKLSSQSASASSGASGASGAKGTAEVTKPATQHSACMDAAGNIYCCIEVDGNILVRKSHDLGDVWDSFLPSDFSFFPKKKDQKKDEKQPALEAPSCFYDSATDVMILFFFVNSSMFATRLPMQLLRDGSGSLSEIKPMLLFGEYTQDLADRQIKSAKSVQSPSNKGVRLAAHRTACIKTVTGYYRIFFKDENNRLKSLLSFDNGFDWLAEDQFSTKPSA